MKVTLKTIAEEAGLSVTTVSRALAGYDDVNEETRQRIAAIAERLGYQPNLTARHLRSKFTDTIGMVIPRTAYFSDSFFMELLAGVGRQASEYGFDLLLSVQMSGDPEMAAYRRMVAGARVDGMVLSRILRHDPRIDYLQSVEHPFVAFGRSDQDDYPFIDVDGALGVCQLVGHFVAYGHRRIGMIRSPQELAFTPIRVQGYRDGLKEAGLDYDETLVVDGDLTQSSGQQAAEALLARLDPPTAIIACNDLMALGAMAALKAMGRRVGTDVAVAGFDDIAASAVADPPLTTVRQPIYDIGCLLVTQLVHILRGTSFDDDRTSIAPELIVRASSGSPRS